MVDTDLKVGMIRPCLLQASSYVHHSPYQHNLTDSLFCKQETYKHDHIGLHTTTTYKYTYKHTTKSLKNWSDNKNHNISIFLKLGNWVLKKVFEKNNRLYFWYEDIFGRYDFQHPFGTTSCIHVYKCTQNPRRGELTKIAHNLVQRTPLTRLWSDGRTLCYLHLQRPRL